MVITRLLGGLGNQMFQYAAGLALAQRRRTALKLDVTWFREDPAHAAHNRYALHDFNILEQFATDEEIDRLRGVTLTRTERWLAKLARVLRLRQLARRHQQPSHWHMAPSFRYYPEFAELPDQTYLDGMFQSERFFSHEAAELRRHFSLRYPTPPAWKVLDDSMRSCESVAVHVRLGDYRNNPIFEKQMARLDESYYHGAVRELETRLKSPVFFLFSDDLAAARAMLPAAANIVAVEASGRWPASGDLRLISACRHAIIANSTFSWWGAWLGDEPERIVIAPRQWFADPAFDAADVVPERWERR